MPVQSARSPVPRVVRRAVHGPAVRFIVARCEGRYCGRLRALLPEAVRPWTALRAIGYLLT